jgi:TonB family protein
VRSFETAVQAGIFFSIFLGLVVVLPVLTKKRAQCAFFCPFGAFQSLFNKISVFDIRIRGEKCADCISCRRDCPTLALDAESMKKGGTLISCMKCGACVDACRKDAAVWHIKGTGEDAPPERAAPDLRPRLSIVAPPPAARVEDAPPAPAGEVLRRWAADLAARARVEDGLSHPYHSDLASALAKSWDVEHTIEARGVSGYLAHAGENLAAFGRVWSRDAEAYGRTGETAVVDGRSERFRELAGLPPGPARDVLAQAEIGRQLRRAFSKGHVASVRVVQDREGRLESVELVSPSIDAALDREALAAVPAAVAKVPVPTDVLGGRERLATLWEFEIEVSISPPIPLVAVEFDEALGHLDLRVPLDRRIWKRVRLVAIE